MGVKKIEGSSDNRLVPSIRRRNSNCNSITNSYKLCKSTQINQNPGKKTLSFTNHLEIDKNTNSERREQEILQSPLVTSLKQSKLLFEESLTVDDHYSDSLV
jgi:hypothetical protein